jgi:hypothetical protein
MIWLRSITAGAAVLAVFTAIAGLAYVTLKEHEVVQDLQLRAHIAESWSKAQDKQINAQREEIEDLRVKVRSLQLGDDLMGEIPAVKRGLVALPDQVVMGLSSMSRR